ncbi:MAG: urease accessory protein UreF [Hyphomicrobiales bacterium]|nr:urease accessory protein UreF [Hyphomicrobiales bacterium]MCP5000564.1 urease accessory protein UreF [Hyphomicrobiales bacterium]
MTDALTSQSLIRLMSWLSPSFPVGAFAYSNGLESAVNDRRVTTAKELEDWLTDLLTFGAAWNDAVLFCESWRRAQDGGDLREVAMLVEALASSAERHLETMAQGAAFLEAAAAWPHPVAERLPRDCPFPVAVGAICGAHNVPLEAALVAYLHAFVSNLIQAGLRLMELGQKDGVRLLAVIEPHIERIAERAAGSGLDDLGGPTILAEIVAMKHETQYSRLFRS